MTHRTSRTLRLLLPVALTLLVAACGNSPRPDVELAPVRVDTVVQSVAAPGRIEPAGRVNAMSPLAGEVAELFVHDGDQVAAGAPVLRLLSANADLAVAQAQAGVDAAGALAGMPATSDLSPLIGALRSELDGVVPPMLDAAELQIQRYADERVKTEALQRLADARSRYQQTSGELAQAEAEARNTAEQATQAQRAAAEAQRAQAEAVLDAARSRQESLTVRAPGAGVVEFGSSGSAGADPSAAADALSAGAGGLGGAGGEVGDLLGGLAGGGGSAGPVTRGSRVAAGQLLFTVYDLSGFHLQAMVDEADAVLVAPRQTATVLVDAYPDTTFQGLVDRVGVGPAKAASGGVVYPVTITLRAPLAVPLRVGMTASVEIAVKRVESGTAVPSGALLRRENRSVVFVALDGVAREVEVKSLAAGEDETAVTGDVHPGDQVVVSGHEHLQDGDPLPRVKPTPTGK